MCIRDSNKPDAIKILERIAEKDDPDDVIKVMPLSLIHISTDVTQIQNMYMMMLRLFFRAPPMFAIALTMSFKISRTVSNTFLVVIPVSYTHLDVYKRQLIHSFV